MMAVRQELPTGIPLSADVETRGGGRKDFRARVRWVDPATGRRRSISEAVDTIEEAQAWIDALKRAARGGVDPIAATTKLEEHGEAVMPLALRGLEAKTLDPHHGPDLDKEGACSAY
jgi:hypothetical protein